MKLVEFLKAYSRVCRTDYIPLQASGVFILLFIGATSFQDLISIHVLESIIIFMLIFFNGFLINALVDLEVYSKYKTFVSYSVKLLGEKNNENIDKCSYYYCFYLNTSS